MPSTSPTLTELISNYPTPNDFRRGLANDLAIQHLWVADRGIADYIRRSDIPAYVRAMQRKKVLDVGCGLGRFVFDCRRLGIDAVGVNPALAQSQYRAEVASLWAQWNEEHSTDVYPEECLVPAFAHQLPFTDEHFDHVYDVFGALYYSQKKDEFQENRAEMMRVLRPGGQLTAIHLYGEELSWKI